MPKEIVLLFWKHMSDTSSWKASTEYQKIAEANRQFYAQTADLYEVSENCIHDKVLQAGLETDIDRIISLLGNQIGLLRALDACGGSGNISLKLLKRGVVVTHTDISAELQKIFQSKFQQAGYTTKMVCSEIADFLAHDDNTYHLITFSSALHHLENIQTVLQLAFDRLSPGGMLYTVFDPTLRSRLGIVSRIASRLEYYVFKVFCQTSDLHKAIGRRLRRTFRASSDGVSAATINSDNAGVLAEYRAGVGIDDLALVDNLKKIGYEVVWHERYAEARFQITRRIIKCTGDVSSFKLLLRKPAAK